jgi:hypothetical protein
MEAIDKIDFERMSEMVGIRVDIIKGTLGIVDNKWERELLEQLNRAETFEEVMNVYYISPKWSWVTAQAIRKLTKFFPKRD